MRNYSSRALSLALISASVLLTGCFDDSSKTNASTEAAAHAKMEKENPVIRKDPQRILLNVAGLGEVHESAKQIMQRYVTPVLVDFSTGKVTPDSQAVEQYKVKSKAGSIENTAIDSGDDFAGLHQRANQVLVYLVRDPNTAHERIVFPIEGKGYLSQLKGYISLVPSDWHIDRVGFYQQGETPSLGGHIMTDKAWLAQFEGKQIFAEQDRNPAFRIVLPKSESLDDHSIDGISGATNTSLSVQKIVNAWMGPQGFAPVLPQLKSLAD